MPLGAYEEYKLAMALRDPVAAAAIAEAVDEAEDLYVASVGTLATVGAGTLTASLIYGGVVVRSGPTADFTDTTATAALIVAAVAAEDVGMSWELTYKNTTAFTCTLAAGSGVTLSGQTIIPPGCVWRGLVKLTSLTAVAITGLSVSRLAGRPATKYTAITSGTGTLSAGDMEGADLVVLNSSGQAAITLTTRTAAQIITGMPNWPVGGSYLLRIVNNNSGALTTAGGTGVTMTSTIPPGCAADYQVQYTAAATVVATLLSVSRACALPHTKFTTTSAASPVTASAGDLTGANHTVFQVTTNGAFALTTRTAAEMFGDIPNCHVGFSYILTVISQGNNTVTITPGSNVTIDTATIATKVSRSYVVTFTSATVCTFTTVNKGTVE